jgi:hypothetical protein
MAIGWRPLRSGRVRYCSSPKAGRRLRDRQACACHSAAAPVTSQDRESARRALTLPRSSCALIPAGLPVSAVFALCKVVGADRQGPSCGRAVEHPPHHEAHSVFGRRLTGGHCSRPAHSSTGGTGAR